MNAAQRESLRQAGYCNCEDASDGEIRDMLDAARTDMTIYEAVAILNENLHGMEGSICVGPFWSIWGGNAFRPGKASILSAFEAIAVAEKYQRESK